MIDRKTVLRGVAVLGLAGVATVPFMAASAPVVSNEATPVVPVEKLAKGEMFDRVSGLVINHVLVYEQLQAGINFVPDLATYRKTEGMNPPCSMTFSSKETNSRLQLAHCDAFSDEVFQFMARFADRVEASVCAPSTESKRYAYRRLTDAFTKGEQASRQLLLYLLGGASPDCSYFVDQSRRQRQQVPSSGKPRG